MSEHKLPRPLPRLLDSLGQTIGPGDLVQYIPPFPLIFTVADLRSPVDPRLPPGTVVVTLQVASQVAFRAGTPAHPLIKVGALATREEQARADALSTPAPGPRLVTADGQPASSGPSTSEPEGQPPVPGPSDPGPGAPDPGGPVPQVPEP